jgi:peptide/nickel transport system permease protein
VITTPARNPTTLTAQTESRQPRPRRRPRSYSLTVGFVLTGSICALAVLAPLVAPYDPIRVDTSATLAAPTATHWLGTDDIGRDLLSRILFGTRTSLVIGLAAVVLSTGLGVAIALVAGYWGGAVDMILMRVMDGFLAFPGLILALTMVTFLGVSGPTIVLSIAFVALPGLSRITRSQVLVERRRDFVDAAILLGASDTRVLVRHILPGLMSLIIVQASLNIAFAILTEASLSFLGVGVPPPTPTWGSMLRAGYSYLQQAPWVAITPGAAIFTTVLAFNLLGDGFRNALDRHS